MKNITTALLAMALTTPDIAAGETKVVDIEPTTSQCRNAEGEDASPSPEALDGHDDVGPAGMDRSDLLLIKSIRGRAIAGITMSSFVLAASVAGLAMSPLFFLTAPMVLPTTILYSVAAPMTWGARSAALRAQGLPGLDGHVKASIAGYVCMMVTGTMLSTPLGFMEIPISPIFFANMAGNAIVSIAMGATALKQSRKIAERKALAISPYTAPARGGLVLGVTGAF